MLDKLKAWAFGVLLNKYALGGLVKAWNFLEGYRTQATVGSAVVVLVMGHLGWIPMDKANEYATALGGTAIATFLEKLKKYETVIAKAEDMVREARKPAIDGPEQPR